MARVNIIKPGRVAEPFTARSLAWGAVLVALGILLPVLLHPFGLGLVLLPMNFVALLAGCVAGAWTGAAVGVVTPLLSALVTGMPPLAPFPVAQLMAVELGLYGMASGLLYSRLKAGVVPAVVGGNLAGRLAYGLVGFYLLPLIGLERVPLLFPLTGAVVTGLPGLAVQVVLIPALVVAIERHVGTGLRPRGSHPRWLWGRR